MFFYTFYHTNQYLFKNDKIDVTFNVRTLILGGLAYILLHSYLYSTDYMFKQYFWWIFVIDILAMALIYRNLHVTTSNLDEPKKSQDKDINTKVSYFNNDNLSFSSNSTSSKSKSSIEDSKLIDKMLQDTKSI